jgi:hypothetical protein
MCCGCVCVRQALCDYLLYVEHNPRKALELAAEATKVADFKDWWWKSRLGKCYYQLGMYRDAEKQVRPCAVLSCPVLSCPVLSCPVLSCPVLSCPVLSCPCLLLRL